jgi:hypothetical protein
MERNAPVPRLVAWVTGWTFKPGYAGLKELDRDQSAGRS